MTFWGATRVVQTRTNDRGVEHGCEEKGQEGHQEEGDQEEGRQEEEVIDLRSIRSSSGPLIIHSEGPMLKAKAAVPKGRRGQAAFRALPIRSLSLPSAS